MSHNIKWLLTLASVIGLLTVIWKKTPAGEQVRALVKE